MDLDLISNTVLFRGCPKEDIEAMARHLNFRTNQYKKGNVVFHSGEIITDAGLVLSGTIQIEHTDLWGNKSILESRMQAESSAKPMPVFRHSLCLLM